MPTAEKNAMLKDLGILVKVGQHVNVAGLIGVCDEPGNSFIVAFNLKKAIFQNCFFAQITWL